MSEMEKTMVAEDIEVENEDTMRGKFLVFFLEEQEFAIPIEYVVDIINVQPVTRVPNCPDFVRGITNLRGKVIPIIDVRMRFGKQQQEYNERTCIIVVEEKGAAVGLIIDSVSEVITLDDEHIAPPPQFNQSAESKFIMGIGKSEDGIKLILDCQAVLGDDVPGTEIQEEEF